MAIVKLLVQEEFTNTHSNMTAANKYDSLWMKISYTIMMMVTMQNSPMMAAEKAGMWRSLWKYLRTQADRGKPTMPGGGGRCGNNLQGRKTKNTM